MTPKSIIEHNGDKKTHRQTHRETTFVLLRLLNIDLILILGLGFYTKNYLITYLHKAHNEHYERSKSKKESVP